MSNTVINLRIAFVIIVLQALTLPIQMHAISDAPSRRETFLALA
jgi:hypothetical protein